MSESDRRAEAQPFGWDRLLDFQKDAFKKVVGGFPKISINDRTLYI